KCADSGDTHQKEFGEDSAFSNMREGFSEYRQANGQISSRIPNNPYPIGKPRLRKPMIHDDTGQQEHKRDEGRKKQVENRIRTSFMGMVVWNICFFRSVVHRVLFLKLRKMNDTARNQGANKVRPPDYNRAFHRKSPF